MRLNLCLFSLCLFLVGVLPSQAACLKTPRSHAVLHAFQRQHPCPSTGRVAGACPGWVKDHIKALACGGTDSVDNLQWQTIQAAREKDRWERQGCPPCHLDQEVGAHRSQ